MTFARDGESFTAAQLARRADSTIGGARHWCRRARIDGLVWVCRREDLVYGGRPIHHYRFVIRGRC